MSIEVIGNTFESALAAMPGALPIALPNTPFTPVATKPYQEINILAAETQNPTFGGTYRRFVGVVQIALYYPIKTGDKASKAMADKLIEHFARGKTFMVGPVRIWVPNTGTHKLGRPDGTHFRMPVLIPYLADAP